MKIRLRSYKGHKIRKDKEESDWLYKFMCVFIVLAGTVSLILLGCSIVLLIKVM